MSVQTYQEIVRNELLIYQKSFAYYKSSEEYALGFATTEKDSIELAIAYLDQDLERIKEELCGRFRMECSSNLVVNATSEYVDKLIQRNWQR